MPHDSHLIHLLHSSPITISSFLFKLEKGPIHPICLGMFSLRETRNYTRRLNECIWKVKSVSCFFWVVSQTDSMALLSWLPWHQRFTFFGANHFEVWSTSIFLQIKGKEPSQFQVNIIQVCIKQNPLLLHPSEKAVITFHLIFSRLLLYENAVTTITLHC